MPFVDTNQPRVSERLPGWKGRFFHSANYEVIEGELELTVDGVALIARAGLEALADGRVIIVDHPARHRFS
jgi:hypothetical protein